MKFLVTGGAGFIGSHLIERLVEQNHEIICLDNFNDYYNPEIKWRNIEKVKSKSNYRLIKADILDYEVLEEVFEKQRFDFVIHLAARAGVRPSIQQPLLYEAVNVRGTNNLLELCKIYGIDKFIFASSSSVYGANKKIPFSEKDSVDNPISPYAATKKAGELICYTYSHLYNISITCLRFFTVYGPRQRPDMAIHKFARLIDEGKPIPMFGDGSSRRDYTYFSDIVQGILRSIERCNGYHIYNLGESKTIELRELIKLLEQALDTKAIIEHLPPQPGDVHITYADVSLARQDLEYNPKVAIEEGVERFVQWFRDQKR